jgi:hypothetical protein
MSRRRRLLLQSFAVALASLPRVAGAAQMHARPAAAASGQTLQALLDTLIPGDETPAASAVGVDRTMLELAGRDAHYDRFLSAGLGWLDSTARAAGASSYVAAGEQQRIAVLQQAERERPDSLARTFFERMRRDAMHLYYSHPAAWPALGYSGPPQPAGFLDFEHPPRARR